ncbi:MAG: S1C family serine protease [Candidatus Paceibacterota bacterium]
MYLKRNILINISITILTIIVLLGSATFLAYIYRGPIFEHFASQYLEEIEENKEEKESKEAPFASMDHEKRITEAVSVADPAVVSVVEDPSDSEDPFDLFADRKEIGGSGFIISSEGYVVTNRHVVENENLEYAILTNDGERYEAEVLDKDPVFDVAVLKVSSDEEFQYLEFGDSEDLKVGQTAIAIGNALGEFQNSVSVGVISGLSRSITAAGVGGRAEFFEEVIQTDAAINPGNSGGPLMNIEGRVIGVNAALAISSQNIGFAIPSSIVEPVVRSVREEGRIIRPFLGVRYLEVDPYLQKRRDLPVDHGVLVASGDSNEPAVVPDTPAAKAGLKEGDIILEMNGDELDERGSFAREIRKKQVGETIELLVLREDEEFVVEVQLTEAPEGV